MILSPTGQTWGLSVYSTMWLGAKNYTAHVQRICAHSQAIGLTPPNEADVLAEIAAATTDFSTPHTLRVQATAAVNTWRDYTCAATPINSILSVHATPRPYPSLQPSPDGFRLLVHPQVRVLPQLKHGSMLPSLLYRRQAQALGYYDILHSHFGQLCESSCANIACLLPDNTWRFPSTPFALNGLCQTWLKTQVTWHAETLTAHWLQQHPKAVMVLLNSIQGLQPVESLTLEPQQPPHCLVGHPSCKPK